MSTRERREEYSSSNVVRVLHPTQRPLSPNISRSNNNISQFDNSLGESHFTPHTPARFSLYGLYLESAHYEFSIVSVD